jgi:antitoxin PrlF
MITSKLTSKAQTTIPQPVRAVLGVAPGDDLAYAIENGRVILSKAPRPPMAAGDSAVNPFATFAEWSSPEDDEDFADL